MQLNKYKQSSADAKQKSEGLEAQLVSLRKELDALKNSQKKATSQHSVVEVRLNRALEDVEKYKSALQKSKGEARVCFNTVEPLNNGHTWDPAVCP